MPKVKTFSGNFLIGILVELSLWLVMLRFLTIYYSLADHSHFEKAIEQLQQVSARAGQDTNGDDSIGMTGEEVEEDLTTEINVLLFALSYCARLICVCYSMLYF